MTYSTLSLHTNSTPFQPRGRKFREPISDEPCDVRTSGEDDRFGTGAVGDLTTGKIPPKGTKFTRLETETQTGGAACERTR